MLFLARLPVTSSRALARGAATAAARLPPSPATPSDSPPTAPNTAVVTASKATSSKPRATPAANAVKRDTSNISKSSKDEKAGPGARKLAQKKPVFTRRPRISLARPRKWNRPIAPGLIPAYDQALKLIRDDAAKIQAEAAELRARLQAGKVPKELLEAEEKRLGILDVMGKVNLPDVRWKAYNGMADMNEPVYRHLVEQRWRNDGPLDLLMERLHQMNIVPDVLPDFHPSFDLRLNSPQKRTARAKPVWKPVEPGKFLSTQMTVHAPRLYATVFHKEPQLYTMVMVDPDIPDEENASFTTFLHWLQPNIELPTSTQPLALASAHTPYIPPHPAQGSPYHRYFIALLPQTRGRIAVKPQVREGFNMRDFIRDYGLDVNGGGAHMFRCEWDKHTAKVWEQIIKKPVPRFGVIPRPDPFREIKARSRYPPLPTKPVYGRPMVANAKGPARLAN
ncbi:phosphatidylethanolamine-binding protein [Vararia minispora EC-137]|uniref:Phosphatidylethanolamine-binding protein n=1 Tax=Vararia minispora EC-137 TaxID=1314806 RepID=A0ACB8QFH4_9AGAM|nr:phosphatidylethanolamine-binding protein [Vararia minispora EC-137]